MVRTRQYLTWLFIVVMTFVVAACGVIDEDLPSYAKTSIVRVGDKAPSFSIESLDGVELYVPSDESLLLILFSHTCPDCKALFDELHVALASGVGLPHIVAVSRGGTEQEIENFRTENGYTIDMAADTSMDIYYKYATMYVPRCYIIDDSGIVRYMTYEYNEGDIERIAMALKDMN